MTRSPLWLLGVLLCIGHTECLFEREYVEGEPFKRELLFKRLIQLELRLEEALSYYDHEDGMCKADFDTDVLDNALVASKDTLLKCAETCTNNPECSGFIFSFSLPKNFCYNMKSLGCLAGETAKQTSTSVYRKKEVKN